MKVLFGNSPPNRASHGREIVNKPSMRNSAYSKLLNLELFCNLFILMQTCLYLFMFILLQLFYTCTEDLRKSIMT